MATPYSYQLTSTGNLMTGGGGEPAARPGTIRKITLSNTETNAITVRFYDAAAASPLTTSVAAYIDTTLVAADAYGAYTRVGTTIDQAGTPVFDSDTTFTPPTGAPTGTGLPLDTEVEVQDYRSVAGVYSLHKFKGTKTTDTTVSANASTALVPFATIIVPGGSVLYSLDGPWSYTSGIVGITDDTDAITATLEVD